MNIFIDDSGPSEYFATTLYTGNGSYPNAVSIPIDSRTGITWGKRRSVSFQNHVFLLKDGSGYKYASTNDGSGTPAAASNITLGASSISLDTNAAPASSLNASGGLYVLWQLRAAAGVLDVVEYTGDGTSGRNISHSLGSAPGMILIRSKTSGRPWKIGHKDMDTSAPWDYGCALDDSATRTSDAGFWNNTPPTNLVFTLGNSVQVNANGVSYVAYLFADSSFVRCGAYVGTGSSGIALSLGGIPRWYMAFRVDGAQGRHIVDSGRSPNYTGNEVYLLADADGVEGSANVLAVSGSDVEVGTASTINTNGGRYCYLAIM